MTTTLGSVYCTLLSRLVLFSGQVRAALPRQAPSTPCVLEPHIAVPSSLNTHKGKVASADCGIATWARQAAMLLEGRVGRSGAAWQKWDDGRRVETGREGATISGREARWTLLRRYALRSNAHNRTFSAEFAPRAHRRLRCVAWTWGLARSSGSRRQAGAQTASIGQRQMRHVTGDDDIANR